MQSQKRVLMCSNYVPSFKALKISFLVAEALTGLIYCHPSGENSNLLQWAGEHIRKDVCRFNSNLASTTNTQIESSHVIRGNLQKYVSTNRSLLQCKTLPAYFSNNIMVYCSLNIIKKQDEWRLCLQKSLEQYSECL